MTDYDCLYGTLHDEMGLAEIGWGGGKNSLVLTTFYISVLVYIHDYCCAGRDNASVGCGCGNLISTGMLFCNARYS